MLKNKTLLMIAYLLLAAATLAILYSSSLASLSASTSDFKYNRVRLLTNAIIAEIEANFDIIADPDGFSTRVSPHIDALGASLEIIDPGGRVLYDSRDNTAYHSQRTVAIKSYLHYDASFAAQETGLVRFAFPVTQDGVQVANSVFLLPTTLLEEFDSRLVALKLVIPVAVAFTAILLTYLLSLRNYDKTIKQPLLLLNQAAREVGRGNFSTPLDCHGQGELDQLCRSFDIMRLELKDSVEKQRGLEQSRKELITKISHDLRTPVASIKAYVEGLSDGMAKDPATAEKYLNVISRKTDSLIKLIDDLLQHSLSELGQMRVNKVELYSKALLKEILDPIVIQFENSPTAFKIEGDLPNVLISADPLRLEQVIVNLVQNAKKYTAPGGSISFSALNQDNHLLIQVKDSGVGVPNHDLPHIFDSFYRGQFTRAIDGAGLGLAICKYIVEEHGGTIWVDSTLNSGSSFSFTIAKA